MQIQCEEDFGVGEYFYCDEESSDETIVKFLEEWVRLTRNKLKIQECEIKEEVWIRKPKISISPGTIGVKILFKNKK